jgi:hypothetical protein
MSDTMTKPVDQYDFWRRRLAGEKVQIFDGEPQAGFYRDRADAVAIWFKDGTLRCRVNGKIDLSEQRAMERWAYCSVNPISHEDYKTRIETGTWPGENAAVTMSNNAPDDDSYEGIEAQIETMAREAERLMRAGPAKSQLIANEASDVADKLGKLYTKADKAREAEKRPHLEESRKVDDKWRPLTSAASIYKQLKDKVIEPFLKAQKAAKEKAEREAREKAAEAARVAAAAEAEAERLAREAASDEDADAANEAIARAEAAKEKVAQAETEVKAIAETPVKAGTRGRATSLRTVTTVTIIDYDAALAFFKERDQVRELVQTLANVAVKAGFTVPGTKVTKDQDAA